MLRTRLGKLVLAAVAVALGASGVVLYHHYARLESTDDAQIDGYIYPVTSRVSGYVQRVTVDDNQYVAEGTVLVQLDARDYKVAVENARAALAIQQAGSDASQLSVPVTSVNTSTELSSARAAVDHASAGLAGAEHQRQAAEAALREAEANDAKAQDDVERFRPLAARDEIPQHQFTQAVAAQKATAAAIAAARATAAAAAQVVTQARSDYTRAQGTLRYAETRPERIRIERSRAKAADAQVLQATAALEQAQLNLRYTTIVAPVSGIVGQRAAQPGQYLSPGQQLLAIVPLDPQDLWVTANFKETQLKEMRPGQAVTISVDTYAREYQGRVDSIAAATGARYSLLPPENATGNYVKVVQRIPVKIVFEPGQDPTPLLRPGMSVVPTVRIR